MKVRGLVCSLLGGALLACGSTPTVIPARNLERPTDMGMVCLAVDSTSGQLTGQPMGVCHPKDKTDPVFQADSAPRLYGTFAFVSNTARGEMSVVDLDRDKLVDLDPVVFGFNMVQVGSLPENLAASSDGCWVASANRVSCDIGLVDPSRLLSSLFTTAMPSTGAGNPVRRIRPNTATRGWLQLAPKEMVFLRPEKAPELSVSDGLRLPACQGDQQPALALVSFPSCDLVALMELPSGRIIDSVYVRPEGTVPAGAEPVCPVDHCIDAEVVASGEDAGVSAEGDGGAGDAGEAGAPAQNLGVGALVLRPDRSTVYVGASRGDDFLAVLNVVEGKLVDGGRIALESGALGIDHLRLSVDPWRAPSDSPIDMLRGSFIGTRGEFLYAFAQDGSVRVVDVTSQPGRECDVNARPELTGLPVNTPCFPVNPATRQPLARGPGIRIPSLPVRTAAPPIPRDIAVVDLPADAAQIKDNPQALAGQFGFLLASDTYIYVLNLSPHSTGDAKVEDPVMTHSFREIRSNGQPAADMLMPVTTPPLRTTVSSDLLYPSTPLLSSSTGPRLEMVTTTTPPAVPVSSDYSTSEYYADFPNQSREVSRSISIAWEDVIPNTTRKSGKLVPPSPSVPAGILTDGGANFCGKGVLPGDLVVLPGCADDTDCSPQELYSCHQPVSGTTGLCLPIGASQELLAKCSRFSESRRRYEILAATPRQLSLGLHLDEVPKTIFNRAPADPKDEDPIHPHTDAECQPTEAHKESASRLGFSWQHVWAHDNFKRCVEPCPAPVPTAEAPISDSDRSDSDRYCRPGFVCEVLPGALAPQAQVKVKDQIVSATGYCVEAPPLDSTCWPQPGNTYHVNAGTSFWVSGTMLPDLRNSKTTKDEPCQADPNDPLLINRIPLSAPACTTLDGTVPIQSLQSIMSDQGVNPTALALFGAQASQNALAPWTPLAPYSPVAAPGPNPCLYQDSNHDEIAPTTSEATKAVKAIFQNPEVRFVLTNLEQYAGDSLVTRLDLKGGFLPLTVIVPTYDVALTQPIRLFTGPTKLPDSPLFQGGKESYPYVYVLDQGRTALTPGSRGQIVRLNARKGDSAVPTLDPASSGTDPFQIQ